MSAQNKVSLLWTHQLDRSSSMIDASGGGSVFSTAPLLCFYLGQNTVETAQDICLAYSSDAIAKKIAQEVFQVSKRSSKFEKEDLKILLNGDGRQEIWDRSKQ